VADGPGALVAPGCRQQPSRFTGADAAREPGQDVAKILERVDPSEAAGTQDGVGNGSAASACIRAREEEILARQRGADVQALDRAVVDGDTPVIDEAMKRVSASR
jgi:hypothetical protein